MKVFAEFCVAASDGAVASNFPIVSTEIKNDDTWTILKMSVCSDKLSNDRNSSQRVPDKVYKHKVILMLFRGLFLRRLPPTLMMKFLMDKYLQNAVGLF